MLTECFPNIASNGAVRKLRSFLASPFYIALVALLMAAANLFSLELPVFYCYLVLGLLIVLFSDDLSGVIPIACCAYMTISFENNPAFAGSAFHSKAFIGQFLAILVLAAVLLIGRLVLILLRREKPPVPALALGFGALGLAFVLAGVFSPYYDFKTAFFGFTLIASLCGLYFFFYYGVDWRKMRTGYFAEVFLAIGIGLLFEIAAMYVKAGYLEHPGAGFSRGALITGWGIYNNVGCAMAMTLPAAAYFSLEKKHGWAYTLVGVALFAGLVLTQSRGSILFGAVVYLAGTVIVLVKSEKRARLLHFAVLGPALLLLIVFALVFREKIAALFSGIIDSTFSGDLANGRIPIYREGIRRFLEAPFFGVGWYNVDHDIVFRWGNLSEDAFLPPRYHDTYVQLLASGGIFALICYLLHRVETLFLLFAHPTREKIFIGLCIAALILTSTVDCHFFNLGPGLLYSVLLICAEAPKPKEPAPLLS